MLEKFGPSLYSAEGQTVSFFGFPYPTRMAVARLSDESVWVWSPIALTDDLARAVESIEPNPAWAIDIDQVIGIRTRAGTA
jgi:hypothetical protein